MNSKITQKILKLLALAASTDPNEAASALNKAREMMMEYNITDQDLKFAKVQESAQRLGKRSKPAGYVHHLIDLMKDVFGVTFYYHRDREQLKVVFVGFSPYEELAGYAFKVLKRQLVSARKEYYYSLSKRRKRHTRAQEADTFALGWVLGVREQAESLLPFREVSETVSEYLMNKNLTLVPVRTKIKGGRKGTDAMNNGFASGQEVELQKPVSTHNQLQLS